MYMQETILLGMPIHMEGFKISIRFSWDDIFGYRSCSYDIVTIESTQCANNDPSNWFGFTGIPGGSPCKIGDPSCDDGKPQCPNGRDGSKCPNESCDSICCDGTWFDCGQCQACKISCSAEARSKCRNAGTFEDILCCEDKAIDECYKRRPPAGPSCNMR